jgi:hypothetical protein
MRDPRYNQVAIMRRPFGIVNQVFSGIEAYLGESRVRFYVPDDDEFSARLAALQALNHGRRNSALAIALRPGASV